jgi:hypothetical protein
LGTPCAAKDLKIAAFLMLPEKDIHRHSGKVTVYETGNVEIAVVLLAEGFGWAYRQFTEIISMDKNPAARSHAMSGCNHGR